MENGATKVVVCEDVECNVDKEVVKDTNEWLTNYVSEHYAKEVNEMDILGITGTNGKTTTAYLTYQLLNKLGSKTAYIGTIGFYIPDEEILELPNTTPNILDIYEMLLYCKENNYKYVAMEVSSQGLFYNRLDYTKIHYSAEDKVLYGKIEEIPALVNFESASAKNIIQEFHNAVDDYILAMEEVENMRSRKNSESNSKNNKKENFLD